MILKVLFRLLIFKKVTDIKYLDFFASLIIYSQVLAILIILIKHDEIY